MYMTKIHLTDGCFGRLNNDDVTYERTFLNGLPHGQGVLTSPNAKISGTFEYGSILRGKAEGLDGSCQLMMANW